MFRTLLQDEAGFIVSAELVLIATIVVIGLIVGLSEVAHAVNNELNDVGEAIGELDQSYSFSGFTKCDRDCAIHARTYGSDFTDNVDDCDRNECAITCDPPSNENTK